MGHRIGVAGGDSVFGADGYISAPNARVEMMTKQTLSEQIKNIVCALGICLSIQWGFQLLEYKRIFNEAFRGNKKVRIIKIKFLSGYYWIEKLSNDEYNLYKYYISSN